MKKKSLGLAVALTVLIAFTLGLAACANKAKTYKVSFMNGSELHSVQQVESGKKATAPTDPTKISAQYSYAFIGWFESESAETPFDFENSTITADLTLYARYTATDILLEFNLSSDKQSYVVMGTNSETFSSIVIPDTYDGKPVTRIALSAFSQTSLTSITIPDSVTSIGEGAFGQCSSLKSVKLSSSLTTISDGTFSECSSLTDITIPDSVTTIEDSAFEDSAITSITIPKSVTTIGVGVFAGCSDLKSITVNSGNTKYKSVNNCLIETETKTIIAGCSTSVIPNDGTIADIAWKAFTDCESLTSIVIPNGITTISESMFRGCSSLKSVTIPNSVTSIQSSAFSGCESLTSITIPDSVTDIGEYAFSGCSSLKSISIPKNITKIGESAFYNCGFDTITVDSENKQYKSVNNCLIEVSSKKLIVGSSSSIIPNDGSVTLIGGSAFANNSALSSIVIPSGITEIESYAFRNCIGLTNIVIPDSVITIGFSAFRGCTSLKSVALGSGVNSIDLQVFANCSDLTSISVDKGNTKYKSVNNCLIETETRTLIVGCSASIIPNDGSVTSIGYYAFYGASALKSITIPNSITSIEVGAFYECTSLTSIAIPDSVTKLANGVLRFVVHLQTLQSLIV